MDLDSQIVQDLICLLPIAWCSWSRCDRFAGLVWFAFLLSRAWNGGCSGLSVLDTERPGGARSDVSVYGDFAFHADEEGPDCHGPAGAAAAGLARAPDRNRRVGWRHRAADPCNTLLGRLGLDGTDGGDAAGEYQCGKKGCTAARSARNAFVGPHSDAGLVHWLGLAD
jgi:hypothetical protein